MSLDVYLLIPGYKAQRATKSGIELGIINAEALILPLSEGLRKLKSNQERFIPLNPPNGWGSYEVFVPWLERYLIACITYPEAEVSVWR